MKPEYRSLHRARQAVILLFLACGVWYLNWRLGSFNAAHPIFSVLLYSAELFGFMTACLNVFMTWRLSVRSAPVTRARNQAAASWGLHSCRSIRSFLPRRR